MRGPLALARKSRRGVVRARAGGLVEKVALAGLVAVLLPGADDGHGRVGGRGGRARGRPLVRRVAGLDVEVVVAARVVLWRGGRCAINKRP